METGPTGTIANPLPYRRIGRYEIRAELGRGAMGIVYKAVDPNIGRTVAVKTVQMTGSDEELIKRFRREAQAAGVLSHPNIVTIYDAGEDQGVFYIAMEYVEGEGLDRIISGEPMAIDMITRIIEDVGSALDLAHEKGIIHRDIKPANIMIADGRAKVMDFGVAKLSSANATATGTVIGTPSYMAPEAVKGLPVDGRADIFSLGVVLYEMLTAKRPFPGDSIPSVIYKIIGEHPAPPTIVNPKLHNGLDVLLAKALAKDPQERYQDCASLTKDLKNFRLLKPTPGTVTAGPTTVPTAKPPTPQVARTLAPPMVAGTVAIPPRTVVVAPPKPTPRPAPPVPAPIAPQPQEEAQAPEPARESGGLPWFVPAGIVGVIAVGLIAGAGWWRHNLNVQRAQQEEIARQEEAKTAAVAARVASRPKPSPSGGSPKAASPAAAGTMEVMVKSNVDGGIISVDGKTDPSWVTPHKIRIELGAHRMEVSKEGYRTSKKLLNLTGEESDLEFRLTPVAAAPSAGAAPVAAPAPAVGKPAPVVAGEGRLRVLTFPPNAQIEVDDQGTSYRTPTNILLPAGRHRITVKHKNMQDFTRQMTVVANETVELEVNLANPGAPMPVARGRRFP